MIYLVDTNVLVRSIQSNHPMHKDAGRATESLINQGHQLSIIAQNLIEFWPVATRPAVNNGLALSIIESAAHLESFQATFSLLPDTSDVLLEWQRLVKGHSVRGRQAHDARLVAAMLVNGVTHLLTFNGPDFKRYSEITVVNPQNM